MTIKYKVEGQEHLIRDVNSNAIVNTNKSEYQLYLQRRKNREKQSDELRGAVKEINNLKKELREIKELVKKIVK